MGGGTMGDMGDVFNTMREQTREHRARMLQRADTEGWEQITPYHYRRTFGAVTIEWWPSGGKAMSRMKGKPPVMIYTHRKVNALIARLKAQATQDREGTP